jgi:hypothetical protein
MKYLVFSEYNAKDIDKVRAKNREIRKESGEHPEKFPKTLFPGYRLAGELPTLTKEVRNLSILESDDPQTMINGIARWFPELTIKVVPIVEIAKLYEAIDKSKK